MLKFRTMLEKKSEKLEQRWTNVGKTIYKFQQSWTNVGRKSINYSNIDSLMGNCILNRAYKYPFEL